MFAFMQNCLLRTDRNGYGICKDNGGPISMINGESYQNLTGKGVCKVCQSTCMVEYKGGEEKQIWLAVRWVKEESESESGSDDDQQGRDFA